MMQAIEDASCRLNTVMAELLVSRNLIVQMVEEMNTHPIAGTKWELILSNNTKSKLHRIENGDYLTDAMKEEYWGEEN